MTCLTASKPLSNDAVIFLFNDIRLQEAYSLLSDTEKKILFYRLFQNYSFKEIACLINSNKDVVKTQFYRIIKKFKKGLEK